MKTLLTLLLTGVALLLDAFVLKTLWGWFIVPQFDVAALSLGIAAGIILIASHLTFQVSAVDTDYLDDLMNGDSDENIRRQVFAVLITLTVLILGFIVHLCM